VTPQATTVERIEQRAELISTGEKRGRLAELIASGEVERTIVFARTKRGADRVAENLVKDGIKAEVIHGNKAQNARQKALNLFRAGQVKVLVATDIVARGIDVPGITHIINYDLPDEPENYVHRIGRTGRNGAEGIAITLCAPDEVKKLRAVEKVTRQPLLPHSIRGEEPAPKPQRGRGPRPGGRQGAPKAAHEPGSGRFAKPAPKAAAKPAGPATSPAAAERASRRRPRRTQRAA
jgi:ATP-dependent RNA helicase RhlE